MSKLLRIPAIQVKQGARTLYTFAVDGKTVQRFAAVSRIKRSDDGALGGYQRPEVLSHIREIRDYIESENPMIPNAVVIAFDSRVRFVAAANGLHSSHARVGELVIPGDKSADDRPGFIVDGQQRLAAIRDAHVRAFPIFVSAFITDDLADQTEQFILVNSTKPLPKGLIYELLPGTAGSLPSALARRRVPAILLTHLNRDASSPLLGMIRTTTNPEGIIKDNSILKMIENSLSDGVLFRLHREIGDDDSYEPLVDLLASYWFAVRDTFPSDWGLPPAKSRLFHGAGIASLGFLMDAISERHQRKVPTRAQFAQGLAAIAPACRWSSGHWDFGSAGHCRWDDVQNVSKDVQRLSKHLVDEFKERVTNSRSAPSKQPRIH